MFEGTRAHCPNCSYEWALGTFIHGNTITGTPINVGVTCPRCNTSFDATGGGSGTFDTGPDGQLTLRRVRDAAKLLAALDRGQLEALQQELREVRDQVKTLEDAREKAADQKELRRFYDIFPKTRTEAYAFVAVILSLIAFFKPDSQGMSPAEVDQIVRTVFQQVIEVGELRSPTDTPGPTPP